MCVRLQEREREGGGEGCCTNSLYYISVVRTTVNVVFVLVFALALFLPAFVFLFFFSHTYIYRWSDGNTPALFGRITRDT